MTQSLDLDVVSDETWRRPGPTAGQRRIDLYVGLLVVGGGVLSVTLLNSFGNFVLGAPPPMWEQLAWTVAVTSPLVARRRYPEVTTLVASVAFIAAQVRASPETLVASAALFTAIYTLGAWGRDRRLARVIRLGVISAMFAWLAISIWLRLLREPATPFPDAAGPLPPLLAALVYSALFNGLFFAFAYGFGNTAWTSARQRHDLEVQAQALRRSQDALAERAVLTERVRIARELHDVVAHHVSVMGVQAGACRRVLAKDTDRARAALGAIEQSARTAVEELHRMLGILRQASPAAADALAVHGLDHVESLLQGARDAGLTVRYGVFGPPVEVPESVGLAAYRIVQEAVTNTLRHARAATVDVRVRYLARELEVDVADDGLGGGSAMSGSGLGLIGMRERVAAHGGELEVGPRDNGGFRVRARLPIGSPATSGAVPAQAAPTVAS